MKDRRKPFTANPPGGEEGAGRDAPQEIGDIIRENVFTPYRERILYPAAAAGALILLPLSVVHFMDGSKAIGLLLLLLVVMLGVDVVATSRGRRPPVPFAILLVPTAAAVLIAMAQQGIAGALWAFPAVTFSYFVMRRRAANIGSVALLVAGSLILFSYQDAPVALRFFLSLALVIVTTNIVLEVLESLHARLLEQSVTDAATGVYTRRHLETCAQHMIERHARTGDTGSLLLLDIDRFKKVNDRFGVDGGDRVLRAFAGLVRSCLRAHDLVFRTGGQQFAVLLPDTALKGAMVRAEELRGAIERALLAEGHPITASIGVSELRAGDAAETWVKRATLALRHSKDEGRNRVTAMPHP